MIDPTIWKGTLIGNLEGLIVFILNYLFGKVRAHLETNNEKPLSFKRSISAIALLAFFCLIVYILFLQGSHSSVWPEADAFLIVYFLVSYIWFNFWPMANSFTKQDPD